jgi:hypothetical protein
VRKSGGFLIRWTVGDISAIPVAEPKREVLSELGLTIVDFHDISTRQTADCDFVRNAQIQSVVGSIVSLGDADTVKCADGVTATLRKAVAIDLDHPGQPVPLTRLFPARELAALAIRARHFCSSVPKDLLSSFAFSEVHGPAVVVSVTLPANCSTDNISVALNAPLTLRVPLALAASRKQGFLLSDRASISGGQTTTINYHYRTNGG